LQRGDGQWLKKNRLPELPKGEPESAANWPAGSAFQRAGCTASPGAWMPRGYSSQARDLRATGDYIEDLTKLPDAHDVFIEVMVEWGRHNAALEDREPV
jgi:hypothetical protein